MKKKSSVYLIIILCICIVFSIAQAQIVDSPAVKAALAFQDPDPVDPGELVELKFNIKNDGSSTAKSTEFRIKPEYPFSLASGESEIKEVGDIPVYDPEQIETGEATVRYKLVIDSNAREGGYEIILEYRTEEGISRGNWIEFDPFTIEVGGKATTVTIEETRAVPERVAPVETGEMTLVIRNGGSGPIEDVTVTLNLETTEEIAPLRTSNEIVIPRIESGQSGEATFSFIIAPDAAVKIYKVPVVLNYTDQKNNAYEKTAEIAIVVDAVPEYVLNVEENEVYKEGQKGTLVISLSNIGVANINYATVTLNEGAFYTVLSTNTVYLGNLESDDYETAQFTIYTTDYREELPLEFTLMYKDAYNNNYQEEMTVTTKMFTGWEARKYGLSESSGGYIPIIIVIGLAGAGYWYWRKRKKTR